MIIIMTLIMMMAMMMIMLMVMMLMMIMLMMMMTLMKGPQHAPECPIVLRKTASKLQRPKPHRDTQPPKCTIMQSEAASTTPMCFFVWRVAEHDDDD